MDSILEALRKLKTIDESDSLLEFKPIEKNSQSPFYDAEKARKKEIYDGPDKLANYGRFEDFYDMIGLNEMRTPRILANYRDNSADFDPNGQHICFTSDLFNEPRVMTTLSFGFIFDGNKLNSIAENQGWEGPVPYDDFYMRIINPSDYPTTKLGKYARVKDYKGNPYRREARRVAAIQVNGLLKIKNGNEIQYWISFQKYAWRKINQYLFDYFEEQLQKAIKSIETNDVISSKDLSVFGPEIAKEDRKFYTDRVGAQSFYKDLIVSDSEDINLAKTQVLKAYIFGADKSIYSSDSEPKKNFRNGLYLQSNPTGRTNNVIAINGEVSHQLKGIMNEHEYRYYRKDSLEAFDKKKRYLTFKLQDVDRFAIPEKIILGGFEYDIEKIFKLFSEHTDLINTYSSNFDKFFALMDSQEEDLSESIGALNSLSNEQSVNNYLRNNIYWWKNNHPQHGADIWNALVNIDNNITRLRACVLPIRLNPVSNEYEACVVSPNESINVLEAPGGSLDPKSEPQFKPTKIGEKEYNDPKTSEGIGWYGEAENPRNAASREAKEECGINILPTNMTFIGCFTNTFESNWVSRNVPKEYQWKDYLTICYAAEVPFRDDNVPAEEDYYWIPINVLVQNKKFNKNPLLLDFLKNNYSTDKDELEKKDFPLFSKGNDTKEFIKELKSILGITKGSIRKPQQKYLEELQKIYYVLYKNNLINRITFYDKY